MIYIIQKISVFFCFLLEDTDDERLMHSNSKNIEIMIDDKGDEVVEKLSQSFLLKK